MHISHNKQMQLSDMEVDNIPVLGVDIIAGAELKIHYSCSDNNANSPISSRSVHTPETLVHNAYELHLNADNSDPSEDKKILESTSPCDLSISVSAVSSIFSSAIV